MRKREIEFVDNGTACEFTAVGVQVVERMGPLSRIVFYTVRQRGDTRPLARKGHGGHGCNK